LRIVFLTAHTPDGEVQHRHVAARLIAEFGDDLVAIVVATGVRKAVGVRLRQWWRRYSIAQIAARVTIRAARRVTGAGARRQEAFGAILMPDGDDGRMPGGDRVVRLASHNGAECQALLRKWNADVVIVYGTLIIGRKTIEACNRPINLHTGWSPRYRGSDTMFWPLYNDEPDYVGVTVHRLVQGVDAGAILARGRPAIAADDDEATLFAKGVKLGAELLCHAARREADGTARPLEQDLTIGREYRSVERTVSAERRVRRQLREGLLAGGREAWREEF
jgi:methionyl-tRNA formyltransferase